MKYKNFNSSIFLYVLIVLFFLPASVLAEPSTKRGTIPTESISHCSQGGTTIIECVEAVIDSYASIVKYREKADTHKWTLVHSTGQPHAHGEITQRMLDLIEQNRRDIDQLSRALHAYSFCSEDSHMCRVRMRGKFR